jgi:hypothetical protein
MPNNYVLLETIALTQSAASVTFDNLPTSGYTDLKVVVSARSTANGGQNMNLTFNSNTSGYSDRILSGNGSAASSFTSGNTSRGGSCVMPGADFTANTFGNGEIYIPNYRGSNAKSFSSDSVSENNATLSYNQMQATLWNNSAAITNILIDLSGGSFAAGSTFSLYGIAALGTTPVLAPKATGGNIVANDGTYWYHAFTSSGNFVPQVGLTCDYLVVAGGGGGGGHNAGGGGGGGLRSTVTATGGGGSLESAIAVVSGTNYAITVGAGGAGGNDARGTAGGNSTFSTITSTGGAGGGGANSGQAPLQGGSGGGGTQGTSGSAGTTNQGYAGGNSVGSNAGGGGGGAGQVGAASTTNGGNGGNGVAISAFATPTNTGVSGFYAGGGGGSVFSGTQGAAGSGGASAGQYDSAVNATSNTGGGAGGRNRTSGPAGNGGSGIVIVRYPIN